MHEPREAGTVSGFCALTGKHYTVEHGQEKRQESSDGVVSYVSDVVSMYHTKAGRLVDPRKMPPLGIEEDYVLTVSEDGFAALVPSYNYIRKGRASLGVVNVIKTSVVTRVCHLCDDVVVTGSQGTMLRTSIRGIRRSNRNSPGVRLINLREGERVASASIVEGDYWADEEEAISEA
jgi:DNA gyrase/topoisomerase IV subunit A